MRVAIRWPPKKRETKITRRYQDNRRASFTISSQPALANRPVGQASPGQPCLLASCCIGSSITLTSRLSPSIVSCRSIGTLMNDLMASHDTNEQRTLMCTVQFFFFGILFFGAKKGEREEGN